MHRSKMRHFVYRILSLRTRRTNERTMSKSNNNKDDDDKNNALRVKPLFSSLLFNIGRDDEKDNERKDAPSSSSRRDGGELARIIRARSTRFLRHASPTVAAVEENVKASIALARGDALTKTLEVHALMDADGKHVGQSLAKVNEDANAFFLGVEREASSLAKTKRDVEALVEAKEKEREKEEEKRDKETKERRRKELKEAMMFRKEEEEEEEEE